MKTLAALTSILFLAGCGSSTTINGSDIDPTGGNAGNPGNAGAAGIEETGGSGTGGNVATGGAVVETGGSNTGGNGEGGSVSTGGNGGSGGNNTVYDLAEFGSDCELLFNDKDCQEGVSGTPYSIRLDCNSYTFVNPEEKTASNLECKQRVDAGQENLYCCRI